MCIAIVGKLVAETLVNHECNGDGTIRVNHCCGCWKVYGFGGQRYIVCNECGEARMIERHAVDPDVERVRLILEKAA